MSTIIPLSLVRPPKKAQRAPMLAELRCEVEEAMQGALRLVESEAVEAEGDVHFRDIERKVSAQLFEGSDEQRGCIGEQKQRLFDDDPEAIVTDLRRDAIPKRGPGTCLRSPTIPTPGTTDMGRSAPISPSPTGNLHFRGTNRTNVLPSTRLHVRIRDEQLCPA